MAVRAVRGAVQISGNDRDEILAGTTELVTEVMSRNELSTEDVISVLFTATPDLTAEFPALAARKLGFQEVPLLCASEIDVPGAMPRVVRLMMHVETTKPRSALQHVYLRGATALRLDIAQTLASQCQRGGGRVLKLGGHRRRHRVRRVRHQRDPLVVLGRRHQKRQRAAGGSQARHQLNIRLRVGRLRAQHPRTPGKQVRARRGRPGTLTSR